jgi:ApeA N-terminal domain 1
VSETRVIWGRWWLAGRSSKRGVPGTLTLSNDSFQLDLEGRLPMSPRTRAKVVDPDASVVFDRVLGETTDRKEVTLDRCQYAGGGFSSVRGRGTAYSESYWPAVVCAGGWFVKPVAFDAVHVALTSLNGWTTETGFEPPHQVLPPDEGETVTQLYKRPQTRVACLGDGTVIKLTFPLDEQVRGLYTFQKTFTQATQFVFEFATPRGLSDVQRLVFDLRNFLTLGVGEAVKVTELIGYRKPVPADDLPRGRTVEILYRHVENPQARDISHHHNMVFSLADLTDAFEERLVRWFDHASALGRVLDLYFSTLHVEFVYLETRFMNYVQAIEGYHRRRLDRRMYDDEAFREMYDSILDGLTGKRRRLAKKALKYANDINLEDRIKDVLQLLGDPALHVLVAGKSPADEFATRVARIRNAYAHNLESEEPQSRELRVYVQQLKTLVEALLLHEVGFEPRKIDEMMRRADRYRMIKTMRTSR